MKLPRTLLSYCVSMLVFTWSAAAYFVVTAPTKGTQWVNGQTNVISWEKGLLDGVEGYDIELTRLSADGLILVAKNVPAKPAGLNLYIENVPPGNDYFVIFINSTHGELRGTSQKFEILPAGRTPSSTQTATPVPKAATVTVTSGPNPTAFFATTFPPLPWNAADALMRREAVLGLVLASIVTVLGAGQVLW